jgi:hypothetical protein
MKPTDPALERLRQLRAGPLPRVHEDDPTLHAAEAAFVAAGGHALRRSQVPRSAGLMRATLAAWSLFYVCSAVWQLDQVFVRDPSRARTAPAAGYSAPGSGFGERRVTKAGPCVAASSCRRAS